MPANKRKFTIGRDAGCDICIADSTVSARHAEISYLADGKLLLIDCNSRNGTFRLMQDGSEAIVRQQLVSLQDRIRFGDVRLGVREMLESVRPQLPSPHRPAPRAPVAPARSQPDGALERCEECGAPKPVGQSCPACGQ